MSGSVCISGLVPTRVLQSRDGSLRRAGHLISTRKTGERRGEGGPGGGWIKGRRARPDQAGEKREKGKKGCSFRERVNRRMSSAG